MLVPPLLYLRVIAGKEHCGDRALPPPNDNGLGLRILRVVVLGLAVRIVHEPRQKSRDRLDSNHRGDFPAIEHEWSDGDNLIRDVVGDPLIHALVATTDEHQPVVLEPPFGGCLIKLLPTGRKENNPRRSRRPFRTALQLCDCFHNRFDPHHETRPAPIRLSIDGLMAVGRPLPKVVRTNGNEALRERLGNQRFLQEPAEEIGENSDDIELHGFIIIYRFLTNEKARRNYSAGRAPIYAGRSMLGSSRR